MATLVLAAVGSAVGASVGGAVLGVSSAVIGQAVGASVGRALDQRLLGSGAAPVERGRVENFRLLGAREGAGLPRLYGAMRVSGQVIWATRFREHVRAAGGGKGTPAPAVRSYSYSVSLAVALCEGEIVRLGKVWADGQEIALDGMTYRLYRGDAEQAPDPLIVAVEGAAPAYRGTAYIVFEDLELGRFGNRIPQFTFEVVRKPEQTGEVEAADLVRAVALIPGTGEYALATEPVVYPLDKGVSRPANVHGAGQVPDLVRSVEMMGQDLPDCGSVALVVSWFGDDLRCSDCTVQPAVEQVATDGDVMPWSVSGVGRTAAKVVGRVDGRPAFGGTPADESVMQAIAHIRAAGKEVMFYPFMLMDILPGNGLPDPWSDTGEQAAVPWRGRITTSKAPGIFGSPDQGSGAADEVAAFFGTAAVGDFVQGATGVAYNGPAEWSYRRFILHYAHLCAAAGGVSAFCIGSEMRALTQIRDGRNSFPAVAEMVRLARDVRTVLGPDCKIGYAADWSEYFGYHPQDGSGDVLFHLDPLWADDDIDFIGIDNYMPLSDWRDDPAQADGAASIYDLAYLQGNIEGGEGFEWYYASEADRVAQRRTPIVDGAYGEDWVFRYKDIRNWWGDQHFDRIGGVRSGQPTAWMPGSKPVWFTELGCPAVDKGTNQPNMFVDDLSAEGGLPHFSNGNRDDLIQHRYLQAVLGYWSDPANNPAASAYDGRMVDVARAHVWAWDARPYPAFPEQISVWSDGGKFARGHWISGRIHMASLPAVVRDICAKAGVRDVDVSELYGLVQGFLVGDVETARASLQPLMLAYGFDAFERDGGLVFRSRDQRVDLVLDKTRFVEAKGEALALTRAPEAETAGRVRVGFVDAENDYQSGAVEHVFPDDSAAHVAVSNLPLALREGEAKGIAERWLAESRIARDGVEFTLPPSMDNVRAGDVVELDGAGYRIERVEEAGVRRMAGVRVEAGVYAARYRDGAGRVKPPAVEFGPVYAELLDLPLFEGADEVAPYVLASGEPWPGRVAVYSAAADYGYALNTELNASAVVGALSEGLARGAPDVWQRAAVRVKLASGVLQSADAAAVLNGANRAALRNGGGDWEVFQFRDALLVGDGEYVLSNLLRGQAGTEFAIPDVWPAGTDFVLLDQAVKQVGLGASERGLERHYRIGAGHLPYDDASYNHLVFAAGGVGLRPYAPAHLKQVGGVFRWVRRTRIEGDVWQGYEVPLGEVREAYLVRVRIGGSVVREAEVSVPEFDYTAAMRAADGVSGPFEFEVAQISERFGAGAFVKGTFNG